MAYDQVRRISSPAARLGLAALLAALISPEASAQSARMLDPSYSEAWLATVREDGRQHGFLAPSERVFRTSSGRYYVPDEKDREAILALRHDRAAASALSQAFEQRVEAMFAERIGRQPTRRDRAVLAALGPTDGARLIKLAETAPERSAAAQLHEAARLHRRYFFDGFRERSAREVYAGIQSEAPPAVLATPAAKRLAKAPLPARKTLALRRGAASEDTGPELASRLVTSPQ